MFELLITRPLGFIIHFIYNLVQNYGLAIILFTILIKLILMPLSVKSQKAMRKQQKIQPHLAELQKKYADDKEKLQSETMKLYKENNISMTGGCLPMLIQMPILFGLYRVIQKPLTYLLSVDFSLESAMTKVTDLITRMATEFPTIFENVTKKKADLILGQAEQTKQLAEQLVKNSQIPLSTWSERLNGAADPWVVQFGFFGLDLSVVPSVSVNYILSGNFAQLDRVLLILIPIFAILTTWLSMRQSQQMTQPANADNASNPAASMSASMNLMMPIMTGIFTFTLPSGLGLYWIISNLMQMLQQYLLNEYFKRKGDDFDVKIPERNRKNRKKH